MKTHFLLSAALSALLVTGAAQAATSWQDSLNSAASQLSAGNSTTSSQTGGLSLSSLTGLLNSGTDSLSASNMNNAAGILEYCAKEKLASMTDATNIKNQVLGKLGLETPQEQQQDTNYLEGIQGLLNANNGQQLNLETIGNTPLAKKVKAQACDFVLKQGLSFIS
ncbi:DUF2501 domain-containing protein [Leclercia sp. 29361]|uniref:DUF2501 domain-containing protein n=1 Tax=Leclercia TaxID=83654 RepID=UPI001407D655|nr:MULTISPECIES: DUF2501 domain-containing protein [Leclercia]MCT9844930.1 DUF2501 domain-containing protein [Leclercia adecarboxylata ATCC 23216 = NBRC 102595]MCU6682901.1 DUF2501 domain-containing protein [Leclercia tamurae]QIK12459.1 DUF2501 domain-containing protein [Leclercia sp. 29361]